MGEAVKPKLPRCCLDMDIQLIDLVFPARMPRAGQEFVEAHGMSQVTLEELQAGALSLGDGVVRIKHRCQHLADDGSCRIYERRPMLCREFDCSKRNDCACTGTGRFDG